MFTSRKRFVLDAGWTSYADMNSMPETGDQVYARTSDSRYWYRCRVLTTESRGNKLECRVMALDYGNSFLAGLQHVIPWKHDVSPQCGFQVIGTWMFIMLLDLPSCCDWI